MLGSLDRSARGPPTAETDTTDVHLTFDLLGRSLRHARRAAPATAPCATGSTPIPSRNRNSFEARITSDQRG